MRKSKNAFTLAEVLITLTIIGIIAAITIPAMVQANQEQQMVAGLKKFDSSLQQAVLLWKQDIGCNDDAYTCLASQHLSDEVLSNFDQISKFLKIAQSTATTTNKDWLADDTLNYYGNSTGSNWGRVAKTGYGDGAFLLQDGTTFSLDVDGSGFTVTVDVNGKKPPNRMGKDTFRFFIGEMPGRDIYEHPYWGSNSSAEGLCSPQYYTCDPNNIDPTKSNGASPTSYVLLNGKLPDFNALSKSVAGFSP